MRSEIKEMLKWDVDRTSPSEKLRDFHQWYKDIRTDIRYQKMVLANFIMAFITGQWLVFDLTCLHYETYTEGLSHSHTYHMTVMRRALSCVGLPSSYDATKVHSSVCPSLSD